MTTKVELKQAFFDKYDGFADKRFKDIKNDKPFIIDDRSQGDYDARGELFLWFCSMFVDVTAGDQICLTFRGGLPMSRDVKKWFDDHDAEWMDTPLGNRNAAVILTPDNFDDLDGLAVCLKAIIAKRYDTAAYKYVVPRTVKSLGRLHKLLKTNWT